MRSSSILDTSRSSALVVEAILTDCRRLRCVERQQIPAQNTEINSLVRRRLAMTVHATQRLRSLALAARSRCSSKRELPLVHWRPISTDADCLHRRHRFGARYSDETLVKW